MFLFGGDSKKKKWEENRKKALDLEADILATQGLVIDTNVWVYDVPIKGYGQQKDP